MSTQHKHTPGPWFAQGDTGSTWEVKYGMSFVAQKCDRHDATLIAAAPDLLRCCEALIVSLLTTVREVAPPGYPLDDESKLMIADGLSIKDARAVIAKATQSQ